MDLDKRSQPDQRRVGAILKSLGFIKSNLKHDGKTFKGFKHPDAEVDNRFVNSRWFPDSEEEPSI